MIVAPTIPYGEVSHVAGFPGYVGLQDETLVKVVSDILRCFVIGGFKNIIVFLGHFQNAAAVEVACRKIDNEFRDKKDLGIFAVNPMKDMGFPSPAEARAGAIGVGHALEAATAMMLAIAPETVHLERAGKGKAKIPLLKEYVGEIGTRNDAILYKPRHNDHDETGIGGAPNLHIRGKSSPTAWRTFPITSRSNLLLFSALPPHRSVRLLYNGDSTWLIR